MSEQKLPKTFRVGQTEVWCDKCQIFHPIMCGKCNTPLKEHNPNNCDALTIALVGPGQITYSMNSSPTNPANAEAILRKSFEKHVGKLHDFDEAKAGDGYEWIYEAMREYAGQTNPPKHDLKLLEKLWYTRNPFHENNADTGEDMFWGTIACVIDDYLAALKTLHP